MGDGILVNAEEVRQRSVQANKDKINADIIGAIESAAGCGQFEVYLSPEDHFQVDPPYYARYRQKSELEPYKRMLEVAGFEVVYLYSRSESDVIENVLVKW